jgi:hypothetical protein
MNSTKVVFVTTDWKSERDFTASHNGLSLAPPPEGFKGFVLEPMHGDDAETAYSYALANLPKIDGDCDTSGSSFEYMGAYLISDSDYTVYIGHRLNEGMPPYDYLFVCIIVEFDDFPEDGDMVSLYFDTDHGGEVLAQEEDRNFTLGYFGMYMFGQNSGTDNMGMPWKGCGVDCDPNNAADASPMGSSIHYEFKIGFGDVWGQQNPSPNQVAGFAIRMLDAGTGEEQIWGSSNFNHSSPITWGHLNYLPEFDVIIPIIAMMAIPAIMLRRRNKKNAISRESKVKTSMRDIDNR